MEDLSSAVDGSVEDSIPDYSSPALVTTQFLDRHLPQEVQYDVKERNHKKFHRDRHFMPGSVGVMASHNAAGRASQLTEPNQSPNSNSFRHLRPCNQLESILLSGFVKLQNFCQDFKKFCFSL